MIPSVNQTETDGRLGVVSISGNTLAICGPSASGTANVATPLTRIPDVVSAFGSGPLVEAASYAIRYYGVTVLLAKTAATGTAGAATVDTTKWTGTSTPTVSGTPAPTDDLTAWVKIVNGGNRGTDGVTYQISYDAGATYGALKSLGTAITFSLDASVAGSVTIALGAGALVAGDILVVNMSAPQSSAAEVTAGLTALGNSAVPFRHCLVATPASSAILDAIDAAAASLKSQGRSVTFHVNTVPPTSVQTEATYLTAMTAAFGAKATTNTDFGYGDCYLTSGNTLTEQKRPISYAVAARCVTLAAHVDPADLTLGSLPGVRILDANGNPDRHDELVYPGGDDARFTTLRSVRGRAGVYINNCRVFSAVGSDYRYVQHRVVMNQFEDLLRAYFEFQLSKGVQVDSVTGHILESYALTLEGGARNAALSVLGTAPAVSDVAVVVSRSDNLLSSETITVDASLVPLGYPKRFNLTMSFRNPALAGA